MKIKINDREYEIRYSLRMFFLYETITGEAYRGGTLYSNSVLLFSAIMAFNKDVDLTFEQFIDALDADESLLTTFNEYMTKEIENRSSHDKKKVPKAE